MLLFLLKSYGINSNTPTRGDNLYRGLEGEAFQLRSAVNVMIDLKINAISWSFWDYSFKRREF